MAAQVGLRVRNSARILQIDGEYQNHELVSKTDYLIPPPGSTSDMWGPSVDVAFPSGRTDPLIAIRTEAAAGVYVVRVGASSFRVYRGSGNLTGNVAFTAYIFAAPIERSGAGLVGLVVRSMATGKVVYNSNYRYLRVLNFASVNLPMPANAQETPPSAVFTHGGKTVAIAQCVRPNGRRITPGGTPQQPVGFFGFFGGTMRNSGAPTAIIEHRVIASAVGPPATSVAQQNQGTYLIIDVTGM